MEICGPLIDLRSLMFTHCSLLLGTSTVASKYEELECLYAAVGKVIYEGLTNYEKATSNTNPTQLFGKTFTSLRFFLPLIYPSCSLVTFPLLLVNSALKNYNNFPTLTLQYQATLAIKPLSGSLKCEPMSPAARANIWSF